MKWQPIETAPSKEEVLVFNPDYGILIAMREWTSNKWRDTWNGDYLDFPVFYWMPLPEPPK
jgi:hypothetical protein